MANRKATFAKRQREMDLKDRARAKEARRAERQSRVREGKGPEIAWDEQFVPPDDAGSLPPDSTPPPDGADDTAPPPNDAADRQDES
jgi:hypothetical protein